MLIDLSDILSVDGKTKEFKKCRFPWIPLNQNLAVFR